MLYLTSAARVVRWTAVQQVPSWGGGCAHSVHAFVYKLFSCASKECAAEGKSIYAELCALTYAHYGCLLADAVALPQLNTASCTKTRTPQTKLAATTQCQPNLALTTSPHFSSSSFFFSLPLHPPPSSSKTHFEHTLNLTASLQMKVSKSCQIRTPDGLADLALLSLRTLQSARCVRVRSDDVMNILNPR